MVGATRRVVIGALALGGFLTGQAAGAQPEAARLDANRFPASAPSDTLLHVAQPGRFALSAHSASGTALDLIDMITGPTPQAGSPGNADGRLDLLLDVGVYKVRLHPAAGAQGDVQVRVAPYTDAAPPAIMPHDAEADASLGDLQQRSFWFTASGTAPVRIEAAGRALADLRLWRDGRDLTATPSSTRIIEPARGHPLRDILIAGALPAGTYRATAYGGPPLPWADGSPAQPFHVREGAPDTLRPGWAGGRIGPFGSEVLRAAGSDDLIRLSMEGPATLTVDGAQAEIAKKNRVPEAEMRVATRQADHEVEVAGPEGARFQLRAAMIGAVTSIYGPSTNFVTANTTGLGGDDVPATLMVARSGPAGWTEIASNAPKISRQTGWHHRFNLGGEVSLLFDATQGGKIAVTVTGVRLGELKLTALDALAAHPPATPDAPGVWDVPAGWYALSLAPAGNSAGVADLTLAPPGIRRAPGAALAAFADHQLRRPIDRAQRRVAAVRQRFAPFPLWIGCAAGAGAAECRAAARRPGSRRGADRAYPAGPGAIRNRRIGGAGIRRRARARQLRCPDRNGATAGSRPSSPGHAVLGPACTRSQHARARTGDGARHAA